MIEKLTAQGSILTLFDPSLCLCSGNQSAYKLADCFDFLPETLAIMLTVSRLFTRSKLTPRYLRLNGNKRKKRDKETARVIIKIRFFVHKTKPESLISTQTLFFLCYNRKKWLW